MLPVEIDYPDQFNLERARRDDFFRFGTFEFYVRQAIRKLRSGDYLGARSELELALEMDDSLPELWLLMAEVAYDAGEQIEFLKNALSLAPGNEAAIKALAQLGVYGPFQPPASDSQRPAAIRTLQCPSCGGRLHYNIGDINVKCHFCDFLALDARGMPTKYDGQTPLSLGIIRRAERSADWNIGEQVLKCNRCGAMTTVTKQTLANTCNFCNSRQIVVEGFAGNYEKPDFIIPLRINDKQARVAINDKLKSGWRSITRWFSDPISHISLNGMYLPFWIFEGDMSVHWSSMGGAGGSHPVLVSEVLFFAADNIEHRLMDILEPFDLKQAVAFDDRLLATYSAALYSIDIDEAAARVRHKLNKIATREMRTSSNFGISVGDEFAINTPLSMRPMVNYLSYRFGLLPVWVGVLVEEDGDWRQILVNGQTAEVVIGRLQKAEK